MGGYSLNDFVNIGIITEKVRMAINYDIAVRLRTLRNICRLENMFPKSNISLAKSKFE